MGKLTKANNSDNLHQSEQINTTQSEIELQLLLFCPRCGHRQFENLTCPQCGYRNPCPGCLN